MAGFAEAGDDLESIYKFLDLAGSKLDYRRYGESLFDILIAGGLLGMLLMLIKLSRFFRRIQINAASRIFQLPVEAFYRTLQGNYVEQSRASSVGLQIRWNT